MKYLFSFLMVLVCTEIQAQHPAVNIPATEVRKITSKIVTGQEYELHILLPASHKTADKKYPVVYVMDSQWDFPLVTGIYGEQYYDGFVPELIIVGVTWGGKDAKYDSLRGRDYTPTKIEGAPQTGGADQFLQFMKQELFPFIASNYKADVKKRVLMGCSAGGLFTMYTLFSQPEMFTGYVAAAPHFPWDNGVLYKYEEEFAKKHLSDTVSVYMTVGDVEPTRPYFEKFSAKMMARKYANVRLRSKVLENTGHSGTKNETYARGLQYLFERPRLKLPASVLNKYVGTYQMPDSQMVRIKNNNGALALSFDDTARMKLYFGSNPVFTLYAAGAKDFYATAQNFNIHFEDAGGFWLETYGGREFVKKWK